MAKTNRCEVCGETEKYGPHKHRYMYCNVCKARTVHVVACFGLPWNCTNAHKGDFELCSKCGKELSLSSQKIAKTLGARVICKNCFKKSQK